MKPAILLVLAMLASAAQAQPIDMLEFERRVLLAESVENDEQFKLYSSAMRQRASRHLTRTMRSCIARSPKPEAKRFVMVANITAQGKPSAVEVNPDNQVARCFAAGFSSASYLKPPAYPGQEGFPIVIKIRVVQ